MAESLARDRSESVFGDFKGAYTREQAVAEANRCLFCTDAPCIKACPTHIDIPQFIRKIATDNLRGSARTIFDSNILGMSCARVCPVEVLCVGDCVYNAMHMPPINIGKLQRFSTDTAFERDWKFFEAGPDTGKSVGLVGGGPASLACAHELRRFGHQATIYEKRPLLGGLNTTGVAPYKMKADRAMEEIEWILSIGGIDVKTGVEVGNQISVDELEKAHAALFFGVGLGVDTAMKIAGEDLMNVFGAVDWIEKMKTGRVTTEGMKHCVVVGGGNTALDCVREARGLGIERVTMLYRGVESGMSGYIHEWKAAETEGCRAEWQALPIAFEGKGKVEHVKCVRLDAQKKPIHGSEFSIDADLVLIAIGQAKLDAVKLAIAGKKHCFIGGDFQNGGKEVVNAAAEGKAAARAIHTYLTGK
ncbi:MAG TPA: FAD-dependent oxidoreductase [Polyangiaceae bacterium]|jgi:glutamate synthase (NADPH/NADH) small chain